MTYALMILFVVSLCMMIPQITGIVAAVALTLLLLPVIFGTTRW